MSGGLFFVFAWMISFAMADPFAWITETIPTISQQCIWKNYKGWCKSPSYGTPHHPAICKGTFCMDAQGNGVFYERPVDGTICGKSNVCRKGKCQTVPVSKLPREIGSKAARLCRFPKEFYDYKEASTSACK